MFKIGDRPIGADYRPYIIAEACNNFNGDINVAYELCHLAYAAGADAIKFQMRLQPDRLSPDEHLAIAGFCASINLTWLCSAFDEKGFQLVEDIGVPVHKIPSGELTNHALIRKVMEYGKPLILSTGMSTWGDVAQTRGVVVDHPCAFLQCTSIYPTPYNRVNLNLLYNFYSMDAFGLSDHTPTIWTAIGAVALGARIIEKHITLDTRQEGPDHASSLMPEDFALLVEGCHAVWEARGSDKEIFPEEEEKANQHRFGRRS